MVTWSSQTRSHKRKAANLIFKSSYSDFQMWWHFTIQFPSVATSLHLSAHLLCHIITFSFSTPVSLWCPRYRINPFQSWELGGVPYRDLMCCDKPGCFLTWTRYSRHKAHEFSWQTLPSWIHVLINFQRTPFLLNFESCLLLTSLIGWTVSFQDAYVAALTSSTSKCEYI